MQYYCLKIANNLVSWVGVDGMDLRIKINQLLKLVALLTICLFVACNTSSKAKHSKTPKKCDCPHM